MGRTPGRPLVGSRPPGRPFRARKSLRAWQDRTRGSQLGKLCGIGQAYLRHFYFTQSSAELLVKGPNWTCTG